MVAHPRRRAGEEIVERDDAIERRSGKQRLEGKHGSAADAEVDVATPIELRRELGVPRRGGGRAGGPPPPTPRLPRGEGREDEKQGNAHPALTTGGSQGEED